MGDKAGFGPRPAFWKRLRLPSEGSDLEARPLPMYILPMTFVEKEHIEGECNASACLQAESDQVNMLTAQDCAPS